ncbi:MAG: hypothetical protein HQL35_02835 [Alphaproteobacteria bacterium]|nr:hypothetical protein [Alphaproteobacteria bacterium]
MQISLFRSEVFPFLLLFLALIFTTLIADLALHLFDLAWIGRYAGIPGTLLILLSLIYSLRKRKVITSGNPRRYLQMHETFTWLGALMVMIHAGIHFNAVLPWLALIAMLVNVASGLVGRFLLARSRQKLIEREKKFQLHGLSKTETERELFWDAVTFDLMAKWRAVHFPISLAFAVLGLGHIVGVFLFWGWK